MRFHPTEEQLAIQDALRGTMANSFPRDRMLAFIDEESDFDRASWTALMDLGLGGLAVSAELGGSGLGLVDAAMAVEVLGGCAVAGPVIEHVVATSFLARAADCALRDRVLPGCLSGERVATITLGQGWLPDRWAVSFAQGRVQGSVAFVPGGMSADVFLVGIEGGGIALVEGREGVTSQPLRSSDPTRKLARVSFDGAPASLLFAPGSEDPSRLFDALLVLIAADALGGAQFCLDLSVSYAKEREQFGVPIGRFQALKHQLAAMALSVEPARALMWYAAYACDKRLDEAPRVAALAKAHIADCFVTVARDAVAAHGGIGYTWEYGLFVWLRRSFLDRAYLGSPSLHRARAADFAGW